MGRVFIRCIASVGILIVALAGPTVRSAAAQQALCFPDTPAIRNCIVSFRAYWERNGGLPIFGYPISPEQPEQNTETGATQVVQWFERNRFEAHPENPAPYDVLLGRLGADRLQALGRSWQAEGRERGPRPGCLWFEQTGHNVCDQNPAGATAADRGFRSYWEAEGLRDAALNPYQRSLALHGLPLTEARVETHSNGVAVLTQWFERGRFEWHPDNPAGFKVLLGLLGNEIRRGLDTYNSPDGAWSVQYPTDVLHPEDLGDGTIIFISQDRSTFAAVDSYIDPGNAYGNTGEDLRNRARDTLARIYGRPVDETGIVQRPGGRWQTGVRFTTDGGSLGEAVYEQRDVTRGNHRVNGFLYGYKAEREADMLALLRAMRDSFVPEPGG